MTDRDKVALSLIDNFDVIKILSARIVLTNSGCWEWQGGTLCGYGMFMSKVKIGKYRAAIQVHRLMFILIHKRLPLDIVRHSCDNRLCCNPLHLLEGTRTDNYYDMISRNRQKYAKRNVITHCINGHEYTKENTIMSKSGHRSCLACRRAYDKKRRHSLWY